jgi:hypothetical protein
VPPSWPLRIGWRAEGPRAIGRSEPIRSAYQPPASNTFLSEQTSHQQSASSTFLSEQISTSHQPPAKRPGCRPPHALLGSRLPRSAAGSARLLCLFSFVTYLQVVVYDLQIILDE